MALPHKSRKLGPSDLVSDDVVLVDDAGTPLGTASRTEVHTAATPLHLAFSTYLFTARGEVLLTRRALGKKTWPGVWTNTCCALQRRSKTRRGAGSGRSWASPLARWFRSSPSSGTALSMPPASWRTRSARCSPGT